MAWVLRGKCTKCGKGLMGKPVDEKTGKVKIRAKEYTCKECGYTVEAESYASTLNANIQYDCPHCGSHGEIQIPFKRKKVKIFDEKEGKKKTVDVLRFQCQKCEKDIDISKKMK